MISKNTRICPASTKCDSRIDFNSFAWALRGCWRRNMSKEKTSSASAPDFCRPHSRSHWVRIVSWCWSYGVSTGPGHEMCDFAVAALIKCIDNATTCNEVFHLLDTISGNPSGWSLSHILWKLDTCGLDFKTTSGSSWIKAFMPLLTMLSIRMSKKFEGLYASDAETDQCNSEGLGMVENWKAHTLKHRLGVSPHFAKLINCTPIHRLGRACLQCPAGVVEAVDWGTILLVPMQLQGLDCSHQVKKYNIL